MTVRHRADRAGRRPTRVRHDDQRPARPVQARPRAPVDHPADRRAALRRAARPVSPDRPPSRRAAGDAEALGDMGAVPARPTRPPRGNRPARGRGASTRPRSGSGPRSHRRRCPWRIPGSRAAIASQAAGRRGEGAAVGQIPLDAARKPSAACAAHGDGVPGDPIPSFSPLAPPVAVNGGSVGHGASYAPLVRLG